MTYDVVPGSPLSPREREVLTLLAEGLQAKEIADRLHLSVSMIKDHTLRMYRKLEVSNGPHAVRRAHLLGYLTVDKPTPRQRYALLQTLLADPEVAAVMVAEQGARMAVSLS